MERHLDDETPPHGVPALVTSHADVTRDDPIADEAFDALMNGQLDGQTAGTTETRGGRS